MSFLGFPLPGTRDGYDSTETAEGVEVTLAPPAGA
jgi:hypothetical protein